MDKIIVIGAGGHAKSVIDSIENQGKFEIVGLIDKENMLGYKVGKYSVIGTDSELELFFENGIRYATIAIGYLGKSNTRDEIYKKVKKIGFELPIIVDKTAILANNVQIGEGTYIGKNAVVNAGAVVEKMCIINTAAVIEHDCIISQFTHVSVRAVVCGTVHVENHCMLGAGSIVIQGICIGEKTIVGAGAVVLGSCADNLVLVGVPAGEVKNRRGDNKHA